MKFPTFLLLVSLFFVAATPAKAIHPTTPSADSKRIQEGPFTGLSVEEVLSTEYKTLKKERGVKLNLLQRWGLKIAQRKYRKAKKRGEVYPNKGSFPSPLGLTGIILVGLGIIFGLLFPPFFLLLFPGIIIGAVGIAKDSKKGAAIAAVVIGGVALIFSLTVLVFLAIAAVL